MNFSERNDPIAVNGVLISPSSDAPRRRCGNGEEVAAYLRNQIGRPTISDLRGLDGQDARRTQKSDVFTKSLVSFFSEFVPMPPCKTSSLMPSDASSVSFPSSPIIVSPPGGPLLLSF